MGNLGAAFYFRWTTEMFRVAVRGKSSGHAGNWGARGAHGEVASLPRVYPSLPFPVVWLDLLLRDFQDGSYRRPQNSTKTVTRSRGKDKQHSEHLDFKRRPSKRGAMIGDQDKIGPCLNLEYSISLQNIFPWPSNLDAV